MCVILFFHLGSQKLFKCAHTGLTADTMQDIARLKYMIRCRIKHWTVRGINCHHSDAVNT